MIKLWARKPECSSSRPPSLIPNDWVIRPAGSTPPRSRPSTRRSGSSSRSNHPEHRRGRSEPQMREKRRCDARGRRSTARAGGSSRSGKYALCAYFPDLTVRSGVAGPIDHQAAAPRRLEACLAALTEPTRRFVHRPAAIALVPADLWEGRGVNDARRDHEAGCAVGCCGSSVGGNDAWPSLRPSAAYQGDAHPADPPRAEEIVLVMRQAGDRVHGLRLRELIVVMWRAGLRIGEALALTESALDPDRGAILVRHGKGEKASRGWNGSVGRGVAPPLAGLSRPDSGWPAVLRHRRTDPRQGADTGHKPSVRGTPSRAAGKSLPAPVRRREPL
jgi:hypothetical protein